MPANEQIVREFIKTWSTLDADRIVDFFAEDGVYHNMPIAPVSGRSQLRGFIAAFMRNWSATEWEIVKLISAGPVVIAERIDRCARVAALRCSVVGPRAWLDELPIDLTRKRAR